MHVPNLLCGRRSARKACSEIVVQVYVPIPLISYPIPLIGVAVTLCRRCIAFFGLVVAPPGGVVALAVFEVAVVGVVVALFTICVAEEGDGIAVVTVEVAVGGGGVVVDGETVVGDALGVELVRDRLVVLRKAVGAIPSVNVGAIGHGITRID